MKVKGRVFFKDTENWKDFITKQPTLQEMTKEALSALGNDTRWKPGLA